MNENRNLILALALCMIVWLGWLVLGDRVVPTSAPQSTKVVNGKPRPVNEPKTATITPANAPAQSLPAALAASPRLRVATPSLAGSIALKGARFDDLVLVRHSTTIDRNSPPVRLLSPAGAPGAYFADFGWIGQGVAVPDANSLWTASAPQLTPGRPVTLSWSNPTGQRFELVVSIDDGYLFTVRQRVANGAAAPVQLRPYGLVSRATKSIDPSTWTNHVGPVAFLGGKADYGIDWKTLDQDGPQKLDSNGGWLGFGDKYWLTALAPAGNGSIATSFRTGQAGGYQADYANEPVQVAPGQVATTTTRLFAGAKEKAWLDRYEDEGITKLSKAIDWGWFEWFMRPIFSLLIWLYGVVGNFGLAIICLTLIVKAIMFPIANKQFRSMAGMRKVQPKMKALQERYKDDKPKLQQEMLKLYQTEKINPAAGCLPILIQIPIFYALYKTLLISVEMRHKPFALWIHDLSAPDPLTPVNLFGFLHFTPPHMLAIGVLPILFGLTMWVQQKLNPQPMDPAQQQIFALMPVVMTVVFAPFAAGLQLYYVVNNLLTIAQQWFLLRKYSDDTPAPATTVAAR
ncbi:membrane protein insertase YidC [Sphingomonas ginkgonis]|uniref:Membrane protein insertase YidC n=1 Tax=Sphingomonas ginkgonis TaxID=2315330 RepID=A0A429VA97_9SPHN|nr:membrane protein insertase YidC [Sphingomonas ginkgonis]RST30920.1 membrane protein insertase YidC [Sphingomonas ginkgonis]